MCGLVCAVYLARSGIKVDIFESAVGHPASSVVLLLLILQPLSAVRIQRDRRWRMAR